MAASQPLANVPPSDGADILLEDVAKRGTTPQGKQEAGAGSDGLSPDMPNVHSDAKGATSAPERDEKHGEGEEDAWALAQVLMAADEIVEATVTTHNKGGLLVSWRDLKGFVPASQLTGLKSLHVEEARMAQLAGRHGERLRLKFIEVQPETNRLIFSERATQVSASAREDLLEELAPGQVRAGVVTNLADFGAFVDLGGVEGLVHISELSWRRLTHPGDVVRPGQKVDVLVIDVDAQRGRVALSRKKLRQDPWLGVEKRYHAGQKVSGTVSSVAEFGVFILLEEGLEGLLHVSEMDDSGGEAEAPSFPRGTPIDAQVIYVSERKRRLALTLYDEDDP